MESTFINSHPRLIIITIFYQETPSLEVVYMKVLTLDIYYTIIQIKINKLELKTESIFTIK